MRRYWIGMGVSLTIVMLISGVLLATALGIVIGLRVQRQRRDRDLAHHGTPPLVMPMNAVAARPRLAHNVAPVRASPRAVSVVAPEPTFEPPASHPLDDDLLLMVDDIDDVDDLPPDASQAPPRAPLLVEGRSLRYYQQADDGTLEFLPGRLEVSGGADRGQEIHFVRPSGDELPSVTFGRLEGAPHRHVQLLDRTVSRQHARMTFAEGRWHLTNLSKTNPVSINGAPMSEEGPAITLVNGDRIEMGAVVFAFREK
ncbi:MAG: FHA domain-containing protein [Gemmatimonadaceae bacterium]